MFRFRIVLVLLFVLGGMNWLQAQPPPGERGEAPDAPDLLMTELGLGDARFQRIEGFEHLLVSPAMRWRLEEYAEQRGIEKKKAFIGRFLQEGNGLNNQVLALALDKASPEQLARYLARFLTEHPELTAVAQGGDERERLRAAYLEHSVEEFELALAAMQRLDDEPELDRYWDKLVVQLEESIKTRGRAERLLATAPLVPVIYAWIWYHAETDDRSAHVPNFERSVQLQPAGRPPAGDPARLDQPTGLLHYYAPTVIQELPASPAYAPHVDRIGEVSLAGSDLETAMPAVAGERPTLYGYVDDKPMQGGTVRQLVYVLWYPEHPPFKAFDPEAGILEGWTLRITLDGRNRPLVYESVSNCGCYYKVFPTARLERAAARQFPERLAGKRFHLEQNLPGLMDAVVPELVADESAHAPLLYYSAGHHQLVTVRAGEAPLPAGERQTYRLAPYEELENLPFQGHKASLFGPDGLVRNAHRPECTLLTPSGLYHAGHPRQRGTQMIYFDQADFDDPQLLEKYLRLPDQAFRRDLD